jgi:hypothetical protein
LRTQNRFKNLKGAQSGELILRKKGGFSGENLGSVAFLAIFCP